VRDRIPRRFGLDPIRDVQVLCPMQRGALGARALNADLQKALNPYPPSRVERFGSVFLPGDKVMQTENDYDKEVFNGDLGPSSGSTRTRASSAPASMGARSSMSSANSTPSFRPTPRQSINRKGRSTRPS